MPERKMVLFDWNGTLINDTTIWHASIGEVFSRQDLPTPSLEKYFTTLEMQTNFTDTYRALGMTLGDGEINRIYEEAYRRRIDDIQLSAGAQETLQELQEMGTITGIISAQLRPSFELVFQKFKLARYFQHIMVDIFKKSVVILSLCEKEKIKPTNCYFVGDAPFDIRNTKEAGVKSVAYLAGFMPKALLLSKNPDFVISDLRELPKIIKKE